MLVGKRNPKLPELSPSSTATVKGMVNAENSSDVFSITNETGVWEIFGSGGSSLCILPGSWLLLREGTSGDFQSIV